MPLLPKTQPHAEQASIAAPAEAAAVMAAEQAFVAPTPGERGRPLSDLSDRVQRGTRALLMAFTAFTLLAVSSLLAGAEHTDTLFAWTIRSRPNAAFLGAAYGAGFVMSVLALSQRSWSRVRLAVVTVTAFTLLTLVPTLLHMHRMHLMADSVTARLAAQVWVAVYLIFPVACGMVVVRQRRPRREQDLRHFMPRWLVALLAAQGTALATVGAILFAGGAMSHMMVDMRRPGWPWPVTPLTSQVIGAWLLSFGFAIAVAIRERNMSRMVVPSVAYAVFGAFELVVLLACRNAAGTGPLWLWVDIAVLATLIPTGLYGARAALAHTLRGSNTWVA